MRTPWLGVGLVILLVAPGCRTKSQTPVAAAPRPSLPIVSLKELSAIHRAYKLSGKLDDNQRQKLEDAALSPQVEGLFAFLLMQLAHEDGEFSRERIEELYRTKVAIVEPVDMHIVTQNYRSLLKVKHLNGSLTMDATKSGKWGEFTANDEKLALGALADPAANVRARAGAAIVAYQWLNAKDRERALVLVEQGLAKADSAAERQYWEFIKAAVINRSP